MSEEAKSATPKKQRLMSQFELAEKRMNDTIIKLVQNTAIKITEQEKKIQAIVRDIMPCVAKYEHLPEVKDFILRVELYTQSLELQESQNAMSKSGGGESAPVLGLTKPTQWTGKKNKELVLVFRDGSKIDLAWNPSRQKIADNIIANIKYETKDMGNFYLIAFADFSQFRISKKSVGIMASKLDHIEVK